MRYLICVLMVSMSLVITGCDLGKSRELASQVKKLEEENQRLQADNQQLQSELAAREKELNEVKEAQKQLMALGSRLQNVLKTYGEGLDVAKDLGLPELQDVSIGDLLNDLVPESDKPADDQP